MDLSHIIIWIDHYKYWIIFPIAVLEGPIITIIAGFLASLGHLNFFLAFFVVLMGDLVADTGYYFIGYFGRERFILKYGKFFGLNQMRVEAMEKLFLNHPWKIFTFGKVAHGTGSLILTAAGLSRVPYWEFLGYNIPTSVGNSMILMVIGYYFGHAYQRLNHYLDIYSIFIVVLLALAYIYLIKFSKKKLQ